MSLILIMFRKIFPLIIFFNILHQHAESWILYPRASKTREQLSLDGLWYFSLTSNGSTDGLRSLTGDADDHDLELMPVPSSFNDIPTTLTARDHFGPVFYERTFVVPSRWISDNKRVWLRFGSVCYSAKVYINGNLTLSHEIGHLPFGGEITSFLKENENVIRVIVDTTLTDSSIPQGSVDTLPGGRQKVSYTFDFFNYGGIDRPVILYTTSRTYINDITIKTTVEDKTGIVAYDVEVGGTSESVKYNVSVLDKTKKVVASNTESNGEIQITDANLWWPYLMDDNPGYLYTLQVDLLDSSNTLIDTYSQSFGIREMAWNSTSVTINGRPIYIRGFGRHEDSDIRGKGFDLPLIIRDHNLMRWIGANAYRTSHYPYAEEIMDMADALGIMILDEVPAVNTENYNDALLENHKRSLTELYKRDKNRPSVVIWSIANEPRVQLAASEDYYRHVSAHIRAFDQTRPLTIANLYEFDVDHSGQFLDILGVNKYAAWYEYIGELDTIQPDLIHEIEGWNTRYNKPVLMTEYGADSLEGYHVLPTYVWSEEYQVNLMAEYFKAFDKLRARGWFIGEMIWNFADFKTGNDVRRVGGNKKGMFTRQRQPKDSAHFLRKDIGTSLQNWTMLNYPKIWIPII